MERGRTFPFILLWRFVDIFSHREVKSLHISYLKRRDFPWNEVYLLHFCYPRELKKFSPARRRNPFSRVEAPIRLTPYVPA